MLIALITYSKHVYSADVALKWNQMSDLEMENLEKNERQYP